MREIIKKLEGKNVCLVGNSTALLNLNKGEEIDSYDVVCRINLGWDVSSHRKALGDKVNILFINSYYSQFGKPDSFHELKNQNVKKLSLDVAKTLHSKYKTLFCQVSSVNKKGGEFTISKFPLNIREKCYYFPDGNRRQCEVKYEIEPSCGLQIIHYLIEYNPDIVSSLHLYGFDFKQTPTFYHKKEWGEELKEKGERHNYDREKTIVRRLIKNNPNKLFLH